MADLYEFVWWERLYELCFLLYEKIMESGYNPDVIIGVARGGLRYRSNALNPSDSCTQALSGFTVRFSQQLEGIGSLAQEVDFGSSMYVELVNSCF